VSVKRSAAGTLRDVVRPSCSRRRWLGWLGSAALAGALGCGDGPVEVSYAPARDLRGSLYLPQGPSRGDVPVVVLVHGGCFQAGSREAMRLYGELLSNDGIAALAIDYRLANRGGAYPAAVDDVRCALRWLHANGRSRGIDPERIAVLGASAGAFLAAKAALDPEPVEPGSAVCATTGGAPPRAVVALYGVSDWELRAATGMRDCERRFLADVCDPALPETCRPVSLVAHASPPPMRFLLLHGAADADIPVEQSRRFAEHLARLGVRAELEIFPASGHGFDLRDDDAARLARRRILDFLRSALASE
jgi:acetyl esterase/lipase